MCWTSSKCLKTDKKKYGFFRAELIELRTKNPISTYHQSVLFIQGQQKQRKLKQARMLAVFQNLILCYIRRAWTSISTRNASERVRQVGTKLFPRHTNRQREIDNGRTRKQFKEESIFEVLVLMFVILSSIFFPPNFGWNIFATCFGSFLISFIASAYDV